MGIYPMNLFLLLRRFAAFSYDTFLLLSVLFVFASIAVAINGGSAVDPVLLLPGSVLISCFFFSWFWIHGGQTLGMRAWKLKLSNENGQNIQWKASIIRFTVMFITVGLGTLWVLFGKNGQALQDIAASTIMYRIEKDGKR